MGSEKSKAKRIKAIKSEIQETKNMLTSLKNVNKLKHIQLDKATTMDSTCEDDSDSADSE